MHDGADEHDPAIAAGARIQGLDGIDLRLLLEASFDGIIVSDSGGQVLFANMAVKRITGAEPGDLVGKTADDLVREGHIPYATSLEALRTEKPVTRLQKYRNGKTAIVTSSPIIGPRSGPDCGSFVLTNLRDVSLIQDMSSSCRDENGRSSCVFASPAMKAVLTILDSLSSVDSTVLFEGETGAGKDVLVHLLHDSSARRAGPFIKVNCGSLPESLLESELFGYEPGAFTGAQRQGKRGLVEAARGGTFFLDEVEALPLGLQPKFLELLQDKTFNRIGGVKKIEADIHIVAASNVDLATMVQEKRFRDDLYYRLSVVPIRVPALRERMDDIIPLARLFLDRFNAKYGLNRGFDNDVFPSLLSHSWPGNIRELSNLVENLVITHQAPLIDAKAVEAKLHAAGGHLSPSLRDSREEAEKRALADGLARGMHTRKLAELLGVSQPTVSRKLRKYFGSDAGMHRPDHD